ncbi:MAG: hypothetical protein IT436_18950 [Phycisphaerales bacterium]|nr:hypothetical protein [Phycisphaerales bacterium]
MPSYPFRSAPTADIEVFALTALGDFHEARERFADLNLTPRVFRHPFAQWLAAKIITGEELTAEESAALAVGTPTSLSWAEAMSWLRATDSEWALSRLVAYAIASAPEWVPERLVDAADQIRRGADVRIVCSGLIGFLTLLGAERGVAR